jgi:hypothetical protein
MAGLPCIRDAVLEEVHTAKAAYPTLRERFDLSVGYRDALTESRGPDRCPRGIALACLTAFRDGSTWC